MRIGQCATRSRKWFMWGALLLLVVGTFTVGLSIRQRKAVEQSNTCVNNLVGIRMAKVIATEELRLSQGDRVPEKVLNEALSQMGLGSLALLKCPSGGTYTVGNVGTPPKCSHTNTCYTWKLQTRPLRLRCEAWTHSLGPLGP
jgi:hypothetical protein